MKQESKEKFKKKGPRLVEVEEGQELSLKDFNELLSHAKNSGLWYTTNMAKSAVQLREKLYAKGYPEGEVILVTDDEKVSRNIVEETITYLENIYLLDDRHFAFQVAESKLRQKKGRSVVKMILLQKGIDYDLAEEVLDEVFADTSEELEEFVRKTWAQEQKRGAEGFTLSRKVVQKVASKGWPLDEVFPLVEELKEEDAWATD